MKLISFFLLFVLGTAVMYSQIDYPKVTRLNGKYGYVNEKGEEIIPLQYDSATPFSSDSLAVVGIMIKPDAGENDLDKYKFGYINIKGESVIPLKFQSADVFHEDLAAVVYNNKLGFIDRQGQTVIPCEYEFNRYRVLPDRTFTLSPSYFSYGVALVKKNGKFGLINKGGVFLTDFKYDDCSVRGDGGDLTVKIKDKEFYIDCWGNEYNTKEERDVNRKNNIKKANSVLIEEFLDGAESGDPVAQYYVGLLYLYGYGDFKRDKDKATEWFIKSADQGYDYAKKNLSEKERLSLSNKSAFHTYTYKALYLAKKKDTLSSIARHYGIPIDLFMKANPKLNDDQIRKGALLALNIPVKAKEETQNMSEPEKGEDAPVMQIPEIFVRKKLDLNWPSFEPFSKQKSYSFSIEIESTSKIENIEVYVNDKLAQNSQFDFENGFNTMIERTVELDEGENLIKVNVKNADGIATIEKTVLFQIDRIAEVDWLNFHPTTSDLRYDLNLGIKTTTRMEGYKITLNGDVVSNKTRGYEAANNLYPHEIHETLTLKKGENNIRVEVTNAVGVSLSERTVICNVADNMIKPERRLALVIGNNMYKTKGFPSLANPVNDAKAIATKLKSFGFEVMDPTYNADANKMSQVITQFIQQSINYDVVLFYYAGHGMQMRSGLGSDNWLVPSSSVPNDTIYEEDVPKRCINANTEIVDALKRSGCKAGIIILDACRSYEKLESKYRKPGASRGATDIKERGLGEMRPDGFCVVYSTEEGKSANDGEKGHNSPFVESLLECLDNYADQPIETFFKKVRITTEEKTQRFGEKQKPYIYDGLSGDFFFKNKN